jgi:hypothetical protein
MNRDMISLLNYSKNKGQTGIVCCRDLSMGCDKSILDGKPVSVHLLPRYVHHASEDLSKLPTRCWLYEDTAQVRRWIDGVLPVRLRTVILTLLRYKLKSKDKFTSYRSI